MSKFHPTFPVFMFIWAGATLLGTLFWMWYDWGTMPPPVKFTLCAMSLAAMTAVTVLWCFRRDRW